MKYHLISDVAISWIVAKGKECFLLHAYGPRAQGTNFQDTLWHEFAINIADKEIVLIPGESRG